MKVVENVTEITAKPKRCGFCRFLPRIRLTTVIRGMPLLNRQNYKSIELFENVNPDLIELLKKVKRSDGVRVLVIRK